MNWGPWKSSGNVSTTTTFIFRSKKAINLNRNTETLFGDQSLFGADFAVCSQICFPMQHERKKWVSAC